MSLPNRMPRFSRPAHGGAESNKIGGLSQAGQKVIDFSANVNPLGPSPRVKEALARFDFTRYPDVANRELTAMLSEANGVSCDHMVPANGSNQLVHLLAQVFLRQGDNVLIFGPTFGEYEFACRLNGARVSFFKSREEDCFQWDVSRAVKRIEALKPALVFLCNPNNPTATSTTVGEIERLARSVTDGLMVIDEAFINFTDHAGDSARLLKRSNVVLLRSMTKDYAIAGLRLGYTISSKRVARLLRLYQPAWSVSTAAQVAGIASLSDPEHLQRTRAYVNETRTYLAAEMTRLGLKVFPSEVNFLLIKVGCGAEMQKKLLSHDIYIRDCASFGLPEFIRVAVLTRAECERLVAAMGEVLKGG
ncbi:MAG: histidinol-phosphate aminotransferase family protein [Chloroflexi bacterium]|nr:histidinol-phosphate aminotransferase family protein [Chloroflexota bacterium]